MGHFGDSFALNFDTLIDFYTINNLQVNRKVKHVFKILVHPYNSYICWAN